MSLRDLYGIYGDRVQFLLLYIREAHPVDGWSLDHGIRGLVSRLRGRKVAADVYDPTTIEERRSVACMCENHIAYGIPMLVDEMDDAVTRAYAAWPTRLYMIDTDGRVYYYGGLGPWGFKPAELGEALERYFGDNERADSR